MAHGDHMADVEIRDYCGDYEDFSEFWKRIWFSQYAGKMWLTVPDASFFRWQLGPQSGALCHVANEGSKLVGGVFSIPYSLRIGSSIHPIGLASGFTVDPDHPRLALTLVERLRRRDAERGISFSLSTVFRDPVTPSHRFWVKYAQAFPRNFRFLFPISYWAKWLAPHALVQAGIKPWERLTGRALQPLLPLTPFGSDRHVRAYRPADLEQCARLLDKTSARFDWAMLWTRAQLSRQLEYPAGGTWVYERDGSVQAMVNYHCAAMHGRERILGAVIALWADDGLAGMQRARLLGHVCNHLRQNGVHLVVAQRSAMMPASAFVANLFAPIPAPWYLGAVLTPAATPLTLPKTWGLLVM
jgi:hypothetical protein